MADPSRRFDPLGLLATLDRHRVAYIVIGAFGRVVHGAEELTRGVDIVPSPKRDNLRRLDGALGALVPGRADVAIDEPEPQNVVEVTTNSGELKIVRQPEG